MGIWFDKELSIEKLNVYNPGTMNEHLGIQWTEVGPDFLKASMPVDHRTLQPYGLLHGGASCVLAESLGSIAAAMVVDHSRFYCVGLEINANHVRSARTGIVIGKATPIHIGNSTHVWDIRVYDEREKLVCVSRLTVAILPRKDASQ